MLFILLAKNAGSNWTDRKIEHGC